MLIFLCLWAYYYIQMACLCSTEVNISLNFLHKLQRRLQKHQNTGICQFIVQRRSLLVVHFSTEADSQRLCSVFTNFAQPQLLTVKFSNLVSVRGLTDIWDSHFDSHSVSDCINATCSKVLEIWPKFTDHLPLAIYYFRSLRWRQI